MKKVFIITGPPGSGKSTYAQRVAKENDIIFDLDRIHEAMSSVPGMHIDRQHMLELSLPMRDAFLHAVSGRHGTWDNVFIITGKAKRSDIEPLLSGLNAEEIRITKSRDECVNNILNDSERKNKRQQIDLVDKWFADRESENCKGEAKQTRDLFSDWMKQNGF